MTTGSTKTTTAKQSGKATPLSTGYELTTETKILAKPTPATVQGGRSVAVAVLNEDQLNRHTEDWFVEWDRNVDWYRKTAGVELGWTTEWAKKWYACWMERDMDLLREICTEDVFWTDPTSFGVTMRGIDEFIAYNFAFYDAIPDWRYDPHEPGWLDYSPERGVRVMARYVGSGHWTGPLKLYPFTEGAAAIPPTGAFVQCVAQDHYLFNEEGKLCGGWTLWDGFEPLQQAGLLPNVESRAFKGLMKVASAKAALQRRGIKLF